MKLSGKEHISYCMPTFNSADTIAESVESIMDGNFEDGDEMIIVNDGSTDNTVKIVEGLKKKYGGETVIDCLLLSKCDYFLYGASNEMTMLHFLNPGMPGENLDISLHPW